MYRMHFLTPGRSRPSHLTFLAISIDSRHRERRRHAPLPLKSRRHARDKFVFAKRPARKGLASSARIASNCDAPRLHFTLNWHISTIDASELNRGERSPMVPWLCRRILEWTQRILESG